LTPREKEVKKMFWSNHKSLASAQLPLPPPPPGASSAGNPEEASANSNPPREVVTEAWLIQNVAVSGIEDYLLYFWRTNRIGILFVAKLGDCLPTWKCSIKPINLMIPPIEPLPFLLQVYWIIGNW
jgi:hypothetical protein